jgi:nicotinamide riboside kinase
MMLWPSSYHGDDIHIALCGSHSTGKTTLLNALRKEFPGFHYVTEVARDCPFPLNENTSWEAQEFIYREQVRRELEIPLKDITISDRSTYDQLAYVTYAYLRGRIDLNDFMTLRQRLMDWGALYDLIVYLPIEFPLVPDGVRSLDESYREDIDRLIRDILDANVEEGRMITLTGDVTTRLNALKERILEMTASAP